MNVIIILLITSVSIAAIFLLAFLWNVKSGQYDDISGPAVRILYDEEKNIKP